MIPKQLFSAHGSHNPCLWNATVVHCNDTVDLPYQGVERGTFPRRQVHGFVDVCGIATILSGLMDHSKSVNSDC